MHDMIGLLGGSFNPIHYGHLAMAEAAQQELGLDRVIILPAGDPPHKSKELAGKRHRLRMAELAVAGRFEVSAMEVERTGKTYTVDTLEVLRALYPRATLYMIIGADTLGEIATWKNAPRVFELCRFAVFGRDKLPLPDVPGASVVRMQTNIPDVSATQIRERVHRGLSLEGYTPQAVEDYIGAWRLYNPPAQMPDKAIRKRLKETLPQGRYRHVLGVEETMRTLAKRWGYDEDKAALTGLLHDAAKGMTLEQMEKFVDANGMYVDPLRRTTAALLHAPAGAAMARAIYGVTDPEILHAIRYHNTGTTYMGILDRLLFVADMSEPGRKDFDWMEPLRALAVEDLDEAVREAMRIQLRHIENGGKKLLHPDTAAALAAMESEKEGTA